MNDDEARLGVVLGDGHERLEDEEALATVARQADVEVVGVLAGRRRGDGWGARCVARVVVGVTVAPSTAFGSGESSHRSVPA